MKKTRFTETQIVKAIKENGKNENGTKNREVYNSKKMKKIILLAFLANASAYAQKAHNQLLGKYVSNSSSTFYNSLTFDNNGKLNIDDFATADYFIVGDTLVAFPDKDLFKFMIRKEGLYGISSWVRDGFWKKTDEKVVDQRIDPEMANEQAELLNEYYQKTRINVNQSEMILDKNWFKKYQATLENLCNKSLIRACKEYFGTLTLKQITEIKNDLNGKNKNEVKPNPELEKIIEKVTSLNKNEGIYLKAFYLLMTGKTQEGIELMSFLASAGHQEAALQLYNIKDSQTEFETVDFSSLKPIKLEDLRLFYNTQAEELKTILKSDFGFKKADQTTGLDGSIVTDFENELYDKISKFEYPEPQYNRVEYSTVKKEQINALIEELKKEKYIATSNKTAKGESYTDYKKTVTKNGKTHTLFVSIIYPMDKHSNEPITMLIF